MRYDQYLRLGYGIGSGAVESAHKQVVHARFRQAGMRWSEAGARRLLAQRLLVLNDNWARWTGCAWFRWPNRSAPLIAPPAVDLPLAMRHDRDMARRSTVAVPADLRSRLESARSAGLVSRTGPHGFDTL